MPILNFFCIKEKAYSFLKCNTFAPASLSANMLCLVRSLQMTGTRAPFCLSFFILQRLDTSDRETGHIKETDIKIEKRLNRY